MKSKLLYDSEGLRTFALILSHGDEAADALSGFVRDQRISAARITAVGAFSEVTLLYFDWEAKTYRENRLAEQCEVAALLGDVALGPDGEPKAHVHLVVGRRDGSAMAGHLGRGVVRPTLEILITETPGHLRKVHDPETGLALIDAGR